MPPIVRETPSLQERPTVSPSNSLPSSGIDEVIVIAPRAFPKKNVSYVQNPGGRICKSQTHTSKPYCYNCHRRTFVERDDSMQSSGIPTRSRKEGAFFSEWHAQVEWRGYDVLYGARACVRHSMIVWLSIEIILPFQAGGSWRPARAGIFWA